MAEQLVSHPGEATARNTLALARTAHVLAALRTIRACVATSSTLSVAGSKADTRPRSTSRDWWPIGGAAGRDIRVWPLSQETVAEDKQAQG